MIGSHIHHKVNGHGIPVGNILGSRRNHQPKCVCVCVQPCDPRENFFPRFYVHMLQAGGSDRVCEITANEDAHILW